MVSAIDMIKRHNAEEELKNRFEKSLRSWHPSTSGFYQYVVSSTSLASQKSIRQLDAWSDKRTFEQTVIRILNSEDAARIKALTFRIEEILAEKYQNFKKLHQDIFNTMEYSVLNEFEADLIFNDKQLKSYVEKAVQIVKNKNGEA